MLKANYWQYYLQLTKKKKFSTRTTQTFKCDFYYCQHLLSTSFTNIWFFKREHWLRDDKTRKQKRETKIQMRLFNASISNKTWQDSMYEYHFDFFHFYSIFYNKQNYNSNLKNRTTKKSTMNYNALTRKKLHLSEIFWYVKINENSSFKKHNKSMKTTLSSNKLFFNDHCNCDICVVRLISQ